MKAPQPDPVGSRAVPTHTAGRGLVRGRIRVPRRRQLAVLALGVVGVALAALLAIAATRSSSGGAARASDVGQQVIPVRLKTAGGQTVSLPRSGRPGVLLFATSTCASCIRAAKALNAVKARLGGRLDALMIDLDSRESTADLSAWTGVVGHPSYPLAIDTTGRLAGAYQVEGLGTTIIYNTRGRIVARDANPAVGEIEQGLRKAGLSI
jgi:thiol-disulfide isomerase/thioredoxin